jgi:hypothetical protein
MDMDKLRSLFTLQKIPGHALWLLGLGWRFLDIGGRLDVLQRVVEGMGGTPAMIASVVSSIWTSITLIALGIAYIVFIGEPQKGVQRHHAWPYVGWAIFAVSLVCMVGVAGYGAAELFIRKEIAKGIAGVPRESSPGNPILQKPINTKAISIQPNQIRILMKELPKIKDLVKIVTIARFSAASETSYITNQLFETFERAGISVRIMSEGVHDINDHGLIIQIEDITNIPNSAQKLWEAFDVADIQMEPGKIPDDLIGQFGSGKPLGEFIIYVAPSEVE